MDLIDYKNSISYVMQDEVLMHTLTVHETLMFHGTLKKIDQYTAEHVEKVMQLLQLEDVRDTQLGSETHRGCSGGERKRVSIGMGLLNHTNVLFLDEPTTGLDSKSADIIISVCAKLAELGRTVVATIHQPSSSIFAKIPRIMLLSDGKIIYNGNANDSIRYFEKINFPVPAFSNPAEHYVNLMNHEYRRE